MDQKGHILGVGSSFRHHGTHTNQLGDNLKDTNIFNIVSFLSLGNETYGTQMFICPGILLEGGKSIEHLSIYTYTEWVKRTSIKQSSELEGRLPITCVE